MTNVEKEKVFPVFHSTLAPGPSIRALVGVTTGHKVQMELAEGRGFGKLRL